MSGKSGWIFFLCGPLPFLLTQIQSTQNIAVLKVMTYYSKRLESKSAKGEAHGWNLQESRTSV